jgi:hypothetical protein
VQGGQATRGQQQTDRLYLCLPFVKAALVKGNFKTIVALPKCAFDIFGARTRESTKLMSGVFLFFLQMSM